MTLAPIRGAPPGAPNPDFPVGGAKTKSAYTSKTPPFDAPPEVAPMCQRGAPTEFSGEGPAISRAVMTIHVVAVESSSSHSLGFLQMSAVKARVFLIDVRNAHSLIVAKGDEDGTAQIKLEADESGAVFSVYKLNDPRQLCRCLIDWRFDMKLMAAELLGDLGT